MNNERTHIWIHLVQQLKLGLYTIWQTFILYMSYLYHTFPPWTTPIFFMDRRYLECLRKNSGEQLGNQIVFPGKKNTHICSCCHNGDPLANPPVNPCFTNKTNKPSLSHRNAYVTYVGMSFVPRPNHYATRLETRIRYFADRRFEATGPPLQTAGHGSRDFLLRANWRNK